MLKRVDQISAAEIFNQHRLAVMGKVGGGMQLNHLATRQQWLYLFRGPVGVLYRSPSPGGE